MRVAFINPHRASGTPARKRKKRSFKKKHKKISNKGSTFKMARKTRKRRRTTAKRRNPFTAAASNPHKRRRRRSVFTNRRRSTRRRRNPDGGGTITAGNVGTLAIGAIGGAVAYKFTTNILNMEGNGKYIGGAILAIGGWWLLKKFYPGAAVPFAAAVIAITAKDYLEESGVLNGLLGDGFTSNDVMMLEDFNNSLGIIPPHLNGIVPDAGFTQVSSAISGNGADKY